MRKPVFGFPTRYDTKRPVHSQKKARSLKSRIEKEEELYYPSSENKGADQLRSYCEADLRLCFRLGRLLVFPCGGSNHCLSFHNIVSSVCEKCTPMFEPVRNKMIELAKKIPDNQYYK